MISPTAEYLEEAIENSGRTQREIAEFAGFRSANIISMMKQGRTRVPIERIPALARACRTDPRVFIEIAMREYHPEMWSVLEDAVLRLVTPEEEKIMALVELANLEGNLDWDEKLENALSAVLELARKRFR